MAWRSATASGCALAASVERRASAPKAVKPGVIVQIHDIYLAFEYPDSWLIEGRAWNEAYLLRAFLEYNERFRILLFISYLQNAHEAWFQNHMPETLLNKGGCFWMEKL